MELATSFGLDGAAFNVDPVVLATVAATQINVFISTLARNTWSFVGF